MKREAKRPDPDALLSAIKAQDEKKKKGKLKIFLGMSAGVGKTYAMLEEAHQRQKEGFDVLIGIVNTHGRNETSELTKGLEIIPEKWINYKDTPFEELDIDAIMARKPHIVLVDELAHTNIPGSRHPKRWQDVLEILDAGIDVYTTLNVQHIESRKELVEEITGISIRETVPDLIVEKADQIKLIDISPPELLKRLEEGKVYLGKQSRIAAEHFFQEDCLIALREIALRLTAEKVDHDLHDIMGVEGKTGVWKSRDRLLVAFSFSPQAQHLLRTAKRLASSLDAPWTALHVDIGERLNDGEKQMLAKNLNLARDLGAEVITTTDTDVAAGIQRVVKSKHTNLIIIGRSQKQKLMSFFTGSLVDKLAKENPEVEIHITHLAPPTSPKNLIKNPFIFEAGPTAYFKTFIFIIALTLLNQWAVDFIGYKTVGFIFLLGILILSLFTGIGPVFFGALLAALIWNIVFIPPAGEIHISNPEDLAFFSVFLFTALATGILIRRIRKREEILRKREENTLAIYEIVRIIATSPSSEEAIQSVTEKLGFLLNADARLILKSIDQGLVFENDETLVKSEKEKAVANWVFENNKPAGWSTDTLSGVINLYIPLKGYKESVGVLVLHPKNARSALLPEEENFVFTAGQQLANYIERSFTEERSRRLEYSKQIEKVHRTILDSISVEFRSPLSHIEEAADDMKSKKGGEIARSIRLIENSSLALRHTVDNILAMSKLSSGFFILNKVKASLQTLVEACLETLKLPLASHQLLVTIPKDLPLISLDFSLMQLAICNLLINASEYTPKGGTIEILAQEESQYVWISVIDEGPGIPDEIAELIFEKFYRGPEPAGGGIGLGLALVKTIMELHGGKAAVIRRLDKGGEIRLYFLTESKDSAKDLHSRKFRKK